MTSLISSFNPATGAAQLDQPLAVRSGVPILLNAKPVGKVLSRSTLLIQDRAARQLISEAVLFRVNQGKDGQLVLSDTPYSRKTTKVLGAGGAFLLVKHQH